MDESLLLSFAELEERHWWFVVRRRIVEDALRSAFDRDAASVLEVGCGTGGFSKRLAQLHPNWDVRGVEPSQQAAEVAGERGCDVCLGTFDLLPAQDSAIDLIIALDVLEHCEDDVHAAREAARVLKADGKFVLTVPALPSLWSSHDDDNRHFRRYTRSTLSSTLCQAGFAIERMTYFNSLLLPAGYASRITARATGSRKALGVELPAAPVNSAMKTIFSLEAALISRTDMPLGMSLLAVCTKNGAAQ